MAQFGTTFDPNTKPDTGNGGGGLHPEGIFEFEITDADVKPTSTGTGTFMPYEAQGTGNPEAPEDNKGKKVWGNINITNKSAQAQAIGQAQLEALARACGFNSAADLSDTDQLKYRPFWAEVIHKQRMGRNPTTGKYDVPQFDDNGAPKMQAEFKRFMFEGMDEIDAARAAASPPASKPAPVSPPPPPATKPAGSRPWASRPAA